MSHVLVVEDDPINAAVIRNVLVKRGGFDVSVTESAEVLFDTLKGGGVDLVLMDVSLANTRWQGVPVNGVELCRMIKQDAALVHVPVLLATAHAMRGDASKLLLESGADGYVSKPILDHDAFVKQARGLIERAA